MRPPKVALTAHRNAHLVKGASRSRRLQNAERLARSAGKPMLRVELSKIVSKYIGETEKNLDRVFDAAEHAGAILFFDEADALFGKRTDVRDSHDRYAGMTANQLEVAATDRGLTLLIGTSLDGETLASSQVALPLQKVRKWPP